MVMNIETALAAYLTARAKNTKRRYRTELGLFCAHLGGKLYTRRGFKRLRKATARDVASYLESLDGRAGQKGRYTGDKSLSIQTIYSKLKILRTIYDHFVRCGVVRANPFAFISIPRPDESAGRKRMTEALTDKEVKALWSLPGKNRVGKRDRAIMALLFGLGLRCSALLDIRLCDVVRDENGELTIFIRSSKGGKSRKLKPAQWAKDPLLEYRALRLEESLSDSDYFITSYRTNAEIATNSKFGTSTLQRLFKGWCTQCGIAHKSLHSARATAATKLLADGVDVDSVRRFLGHKSIHTTLKFYDKRRKEAESCPAEQHRGYSFENIK